MTVKKEELPTRSAVVSFKQRYEPPLRGLKIKAYKLISLGIRALFEMTIRPSIPPKAGHYL